MLVSDIVRRNAMFFGDRDAVVVPGVETRSWADLDLRTNRFARALAELGVAKGARLATYAPNCSEYIDFFFACAKSGVIGNTTNVRLAGDEIAAYLRYTEPEAILVHADLAAAASSFLADVPSLRHVIGIGDGHGFALDLEDLIAGERSDDPGMNIDETDVYQLGATSGTTGTPKSRVALEDFRTDYELFSETLPDKYFPKGANWLMLGPSGPRRLRLSVEHLAQYRGGIAFCVDLDPRWVVKLIKRGWHEHLEAYKDHVIDQAVTILKAGHNVQCMFTTPKLLESLALRLEKMGTTIREVGITGIFSGGTEFTPQWNRFAHEELLDGVYMTPTYGNTLMGLAASAPSSPENNYKISYYAPQPRAVIEVVDFDNTEKVVDYGETGRVRLTTLTKEFFVPGFFERDEGERERPYKKYPWDGVSGVRPFRGVASGTTVGVY